MATGPRRTTFRELQAELTYLAERAGDPTPVFRVVADDLRDAQRENFQRGGRPKWKALSPAYAAQKAREGRSPQVGVYTGGLRASLIQERDRYHVDRVTADRSLVVGSSNPVANLFNGKHRTRNQPKRKAFVLTPTMRRDYLDRVQRFLISGDT